MDPTAGTAGTAGQLRVVERAPRQDTPRQDTQAADDAAFAELARLLLEGARRRRRERAAAGGARGAPEGPLGRPQEGGQLAQE